MLLSQSPLTWTLETWLALAGTSPPRWPLSRTTQASLASRSGASGSARLLKADEQPFVVFVLAVEYPYRLFLARADHAHDASQPELFALSSETTPQARQTGACIHLLLPASAKARLLRARLLTFRLWLGTGRYPTTTRLSQRSYFR